MYILAIAILAAVVVKGVYGETQRPEEGQVSGVDDPARRGAVERLEADLRGLLRTGLP